MGDAQHDCSRVTLPVKADPREMGQTHQTHIGLTAGSRFFCLDTTFQPCAPLETCRLNRFRVPRTFPGKEGTPAVPKNWETQSLWPRQAEELRRVRSARPRRVPTPTAAHPRRPPPGTPGSRRAPWRAPSPQNTAKSLREHGGEQLLQPPGFHQQQYQCPRPGHWRPTPAP